MATKTIADISVAGKTVLMRVDFNVPLKAGKITNDKRIKAALPSIQHVLAGGGKLVLMSHLGRPAETGYEEEFSLKPVAVRLAELLGKPVTLGPREIVGPEAEKIVAGMKAGEVLLLENVRFSPAETINDKAKKNADKKLTPEQAALQEAFVAALAKLGNVYVNDAFGACHRKHASTYGVAKAIQKAGGPAVAGFLVEKEIKYLSEAVANPKRPFVAILGGAKVSDKIKLIGTLLKKVDKILIGGAMAYTLLKAKGVPVGASRIEIEQVDAMKPLLEQAGEKIMLPVDHVATDDFTAGKPKAAPGGIPDGLMGMDIGPATVAAFSAAISSAGTVIWNGPMGVFERPEYAAGTRAVGEAMAAATAKGTITVIGGGDSATAVEEMDLADKMTHVSTGGGASLEYLEGKPLAPIETLDTK